MASIDYHPLAVTMLRQALQAHGWRHGVWPTKGQYIGQGSYWVGNHCYSLAILHQCIYLYRWPTGYSRYAYRQVNGKVKDRVIQWIIDGEKGDPPI